MKASVISSIAIFAASALAAPTTVNIPVRRQTTLDGVATIQFEIAPDTFTSDTDITVGTRSEFDIQLIGATIASVTGVDDPDSGNSLTKTLQYFGTLCLHCPSILPGHRPEHQPW